MVVVMEHQRQEGNHGDELQQGVLLKRKPKAATVRKDQINSNSYLDQDRIEKVMVIVEWLEACAA